MVEPAARRGEEFPLGEEVTVGRAGGCGVPIPDDTFVSQLHARVFRRDGDLFVEDLGSTNGTYPQQTQDHDRGHHAEGRQAADRQDDHGSPPVIQLRAGAATDVGLVRTTNQDELLIASPLFAVADGMGGPAAGEVAAATAITHLHEAFVAAGEADRRYPA